MSQSDFGNLESPLTGTALINTYLEPWRNALHSLHSGTSRPSYAGAGMMWLDTTANPWLLKIFDGSDDITVGRINTTSNTMTLTGDVRAKGSTGIAFYNDSGTLVGTLGASSGTGGSWEGQQNFKDTLQAEGKFALKDKSELTISAGVITVTGSHHTIDTESDASSDDLDTINGGVDGMLLVVRAENTARTVVLKHDTGNIVTSHGADITLDEVNKEVTLKYDAGTNDWHVIAEPVLVSSDRIDSGSATDGQVLTADGLGGAAFEDAGGGSGGLTLLGSLDVSSAVTSVDIGSGLDLDVTFDNTYERYVIDVIDAVPATDDTIFSIRMSTDGGSTFDSGSTDYKTITLGARSGDTSSTNTSNNGAAAITTMDATVSAFNGAGNAAGESFNSVMTLFNPAGTKETIIMGELAFISADDTLIRAHFAGSRDSAADVDAIRLYMSSGNISSAKIKVYGVKK